MLLLSSTENTVQHYTMRKANGYYADNRRPMHFTNVEIPFQVGYAMLAFTHL